MNFNFTFNFDVPAARLSEEIQKYNQEGWYITKGTMKEDQKTIELTAVHVESKTCVYASGQQVVINQIAKKNL